MAVSPSCPPAQPESGWGGGPWVPDGVRWARRQKIPLLERSWKHHPCLEPPYLQSGALTPPWPPGPHCGAERGVSKRAEGRKPGHPGTWAVTASSVRAPGALVAIWKSLANSGHFHFPQQQLAQIETDLKSRTAAYNTLKTNLENLEKKSM